MWVIFYRRKLQQSSSIKFLISIITERLFSYKHCYDLKLPRSLRDTRIVCISNAPPWLCSVTTTFLSNEGQARKVDVEGAVFNYVATEDWIVVSLVEGKLFFLTYRESHRCCPTVTNILAIALIRCVVNCAWCIYRTWRMTREPRQKKVRVTNESGSIVSF